MAPLPSYFLPKEEQTSRVTFEEPQISKIGYPKRLGIRQATFQPVREELLIERPRRFRKPLKRYVRQYKIFVEVLFTDKTSMKYERLYRVDTLDVAMARCDRDLAFMIGIYLQVHHQRYSRKKT